MTNYLECDGRCETRSLGLDVGDRRIGVALSDPMGMLATPLLVIERQEIGVDINAILQIVKKYQVEQIIVGLPQSMNGTMGAQAEKVKIFGEALKQVSPTPVDFRDERLSTVSAMRLIREAGTRKAKKKKGEYDTAEAAIILQTYLDEIKPLEEPSIE
jgi:putative holliday junction resolvase